MGHGPEWDSEVAQRMSESGKRKRSELKFWQYPGFLCVTCFISSKPYCERLGYIKAVVVI